MQRIWVLNGTNVTYDHDLTASVLASLNAGIIEGFDISGSGASANITPWKALIECTRTNGQKVMVYFESTANVPIDMSGTKKVYILVNQAKLDDWSANALDGTWVASITTNASAYPSWNYVKLYNVSSWTPTDDRVSIKSKLKRVWLTAYRLLLIDANGNETELEFGTTWQVLQSNGASAMPTWWSVTASQSNTIVLTWQTVDAWVSAKDPVYFDDVSSSWKKAIYWSTTPTWLYLWTTWEINLFWKVTTTWLTAWKFYYLQDAWGIWTTIGTTKIKIWFAKSTTELLVDIDIDNSGSVKVSAWLLQNLVSYWKADTNGSFPDSFWANTWTINGATYTASWKINGAYQFDGVNDYIDTNVQCGVTFSISAWIKYDSIANTDITRSLSERQTAWQSAWWFLRTNDTTNNRLQLEFYTTWPTNKTITDTIALTTWVFHHIVITFDDVNKRARVYKNWALMWSEVIYTWSLLNGDWNFNIWRQATSYFQGIIDEIWLWSWELTSDQVIQLYNSWNGLPFTSF